MTSHPFDKIIVNVKDNLTTSLIFTPCPGTKGVSLTDSLVQLNEAGADNIITMMPMEELERFNVQNIGDVCLQKKMSWYHLPVADDEAPTAEFELAWKTLQTEIISKLEQQQSFVIHCKGGTGRTGLMAVILMSHLGISQDEAVALVQTVRPKSLRIEPHVNYLNSLYQKK